MIPTGADRGVSDVVGVVLLVAVVVIFVAGAGLFFQDLARDFQNTEPQLRIGFDENATELDAVPAGNTANVLVVTHQGGDPVKTDRLRVLVNGNPAYDVGNSGRVVGPFSADATVFDSDGKFELGDSLRIVVHDADASSVSYPFSSGTQVDRATDNCESNPDTGNTAFKVTGGGPIPCHDTFHDGDTVEIVYDSSGGGQILKTHRLEYAEPTSTPSGSGGPGVLQSTGMVITAPDGAVGQTETLDIDVDSAAALGQTGDVDSDSRPEIPYVDSNGNLRLNDSQGEIQTLVDADAVSDTKKPDTQKTLMAVGTWDGSPTSVFYADKDHNEIYGIAPGGSPTLVEDLSGNNGVNSVLGIGDIDGDDSDELVYADSSQEVRYVDDDESLETTGVTSGSNNGIGNGELHDFDSDGTAEAVIVDGSNDVVLLDDGGTDGTPAQSDVSAAKSPVTVADVDDDGEQEIVFVDGSHLKYIDDVDGSPTVETLEGPSGNKIDATQTTGVVS